MAWAVWAFGQLLGGSGFMLLVVGCLLVALCFLGLVLSICLWYVWRKLDKLIAKFTGKKR